MPDKSARKTDNESGKYYIDESCIDCDACRAAAPDNFGRNEEGGYSFVSRQPESDEEIQLCVEAMTGCPTESIGDDGEE